MRRGKATAGDATLRTLGIVDDVYYGSANMDIVNGGYGDDILRTGGGNDTLIGGRGNDLLDGGAGADTLTGGADDDIFVLELADGARAADVVKDFGTGDNKIRVDTTDGDEATLAELKSAANIGIKTEGGNTLIYYLGTADDSVLGTGDDELVMTLEDYTTNLTFTDFEIV